MSSTPLRYQLGIVAEFSLVVALVSHRCGRLVLWLLFVFVFAGFPAFGQAPTITPRGVVTAASYSQPVSPGSIASIFGANLAASTLSATGTPLPISLGGTSVTVNGVSAPLFFVSPTQINLQIPSSLSPSESNYTSLNFVVTAAAGSSVPAQAPASFVSPAMFTQDESGCGPSAALNVAPDGTVSLNSPSNSAAPGDFISLYGTGLGTVYPQQPPDGMPPPGLDVLAVSVDVLLAGNTATTYNYKGLAPTLVGVDQINVQIPPGTQEGCAIPIALYSQPFLSPTTTISIHSGRGPCVDPPIQSYGQVSLTKTIISGTGNDVEDDVFAASFPSAPGLPAPASQGTLPAGAYQPGVAPVEASRSCAVAGYTLLSAGSITVQSAGSGVTVEAQPVSTTGGVTYQQALPTGFVEPGQYILAGSGNTITFQGTLTIGSPIQIQTDLSPGTQIDASSGQPFSVQWTGGDPGTLVKVTLLSGDPVYPAYVYAEADAASGSVTFDPHCIEMGTGAFCSFDVPPSNVEQVIVEVSPDPANITTFQSHGLTGGVYATWTYCHVFNGLTLN